MTTPLIIFHPVPSPIASRTCQHFFEHQESHRLFLRKIILGRWYFDGIAALWGIANASFQRPCQRPNRQYTADETTQTIKAGTYVKTTERGQGRAANV
jgi:hypothetical protein